MTANAQLNTSVRSAALRVLGTYVAATTAVHLWNMAHGHWSAWYLAVQGILLFAAFVQAGSSHRIWRRMGDWLPLISLPFLYGGLPWSTWLQGLHDPTVQLWDRGLFGTDPARTLAGKLPWLLVSELLHLAYLSYYAIIYVPAVFLYLKRERLGGFHHLVLTFTLAMVSCFAVFLTFPVEGPRYAWSAPPGVPHGQVRDLVLMLLEAGSTRGTAFPSSHVALAIAISIAVMKATVRLGVFLAVTTVALGFGAVYGGFHYAVDVLAGAAWGIGAQAVAAGWERRLRSEEADPVAIPN